MIWIIILSVALVWLMLPKDDNEWTVLSKKPPKHEQPEFKHESKYMGEVNYKNKKEVDH